jgi:predicted Zn finger-like uncharacterized protein
MQTTCPECRTTFRVSQDHLGARRGMVRCGTCNAVFNAYDTLLPELESPPEETSPPEMDQALPAPEQEEPGPADVVEVQGNPPESGDVEAGYRPQTPEQQSASEIESAVPEGEADPQLDAKDSATAVAVPPQAQPEPVADAEVAPAKPARDILLEPLRTKPAKPPRTWKDWMYLGLAMLLILLLGLQTTYFLRAELAAAMPFSRPFLEALCRPVQCSVALPEQLTQAAIAASSLEHDPENKSRVRLTVLLANRTGQTQAWPQITLTLSDVRQAPVAQQVFRPQAYLPKDVQIEAGMAADLEREVRLDLDFGNLVASGYAVSLTYP